MKFPHLEDINVTNKTVLVRVDLNVPMAGGRVTDNTRIIRLLPTLNFLLKKKARIVLLSHFGRPKGEVNLDMSLAPLVDPLSEALGREVKFCSDCISDDARGTVKNLKAGEVLLLENLRFHPQEQKGDAAFAKKLASLGDVFVNDAFSASHRAHASITGIAQHLPVAAGRLMQQELEVLDSIFSGTKKPIAAVIGGSKISTKLELLENLTKTMDMLILGGAMANTFLYAQGHTVGKSLVEKDMKATALKILRQAEKNGCQILLPSDVVVTSSLTAHSPCNVVESDAIPADSMAIDLGPETVEAFSAALQKCKTVIWNGPLGAFEVAPFATGTVSVARTIAKLTESGKVRSIAGGGDTVAALTQAGLAQSFSYISTGGGAFLEWLEGKALPGISQLLKASGGAGQKRRAAR